MKGVRKILLVFIPFAILVSCKPNVENITVNITPLRASSIYDVDAVSQYLGNHTDTNKSLADEYFDKGLRVQETNLTQSIYYYKRSLTIYPDFGHYKLLVPLLYQAGCYGEMNELCRFLVLPRSLDSASALYGKYLLSQPDFDLVCDYVVSNILLYNTVWNSKAEETALTKGLGIKLEDVKKRVLSDNRVKLSAPTEENKNALWDLLTSDEKASYFNNEPTSDNYREFIKDTSRVFEIDKSLVQQFDYRITDNYNFNENLEEVRNDFDALDEKYGKLIPEKEYGNYFERYNFERNITLNDSINILIYAYDTSELSSPKDMRNIYHRLVTYTYRRTDNGEIPTQIDSKIVAVQSGEELSTVKFNRNIFTITYFKRTWEKPYVKIDFDNHLNKIEQTGEQSFEISPAGHIKEVSTSAGNKATL